MNYTKGEWRLEHLLAGQYPVYIYDENGMAIAEATNRLDGINNEKAKEEMIANARLIAAAPDMYEALKAVLSSAVCDDFDKSGLAITHYAIDGNIRKLINQALSKADGKYNAEYTKEDSIQDAKTLKRWTVKK